jgi:excisionase family DNA binding protein
VFLAELATVTTDSIALSTDLPLSTVEVARLLGLAVRSVQLMVDRGELEAWKTPGGHRRISNESVQRWLASHQGRPPGSGIAERTVTAPPAVVSARPAAAARAPCVLLIEDSKHYQNLVGLLVRQAFPEVRLDVADDGIAGLAMAGHLQPDVLIVDIMLPGIDGPTLIMSLRSHAQFSRSRLIVITSLDEAQRAPFAFALEGVPVVHKSNLVVQLPARLRAALLSATPNPNPAPLPP